MSSIGILYVINVSMIVMSLYYMGKVLSKNKTSDKVALDAVNSLMMLSLAGIHIIKGDAFWVILALILFILDIVAFCLHMSELNEEREFEAERDFLDEKKFLSNRRIKKHLSEVDESKRVLNEFINEIEKYGSK
jgi:multisubunit Na+/H+ antiporter MnhF subunit